MPSVQMMIKEYGTSKYSKRKRRDYKCNNIIKQFKND